MQFSRKRMEEGSREAHVIMHKRQGCHAHARSPACMVSFAKSTIFQYMSPVKCQNLQYKMAWVKLSRRHIFVEERGLVGTQISPSPNTPRKSEVSTNMWNY